MTTLVSLALVIFGLTAYHFLPVSDLPSVDYPTILVSANLPGASAEEIETSITKPVEEAVNAIAGITEQNVDEVLATGVQAIAVTAAVCAADNPRDAAARFKQKLMRHRGTESTEKCSK